MRYSYQSGLIIPFAQKFKKQLFFLVAALLTSSFVMMSLSAKAASTTVLVTPDDMATSLADVTSDPSSWFFYNDETDTIDNSLGSFVLGPDTAPVGNGSVQISVSGTERRNLATYQFSGTELSDITELKFSTYNPSAGNPGSTSRSGYLNFNVDFDGSDTWQRRLVFIPKENGTVTQNSWQEWDAINSGNALWSYSGSNWPVTGESGSTEKTWSQILTDYPGVRVRVTDSWFGVRVGEPYADGYTENIDAFKFGVNGDTTVFNFDVVPTLEYSVNGGGHILGDETAKRKNQNDISFGVNVEQYNTGLMGTATVRFHNVSVNMLDKTTFHANEITDFNYFNGNANCDAAMNFTALGTLGGESGYKLLVTAGDNEDTMRFELRNSSNAVVYDTRDAVSGDFSDDSNCVGTARTNLDKGNITINKYE